MDCTAYRRSLLTDPGHPGEALVAHAAQCLDCRQYTQRAMQFEGRLVEALQVEVADARNGTAAASGVARRRQRGRTARLRRRGLAIAASVLLATFGAGFLWLVAPGRILAAAVVEHMADEPDAWMRLEVPVPERKLEAVMSESGVHLKPGVGLISYVNRCEFRGHWVPHLVVQTAAGAVTVMLLVHESVPRRVQFNEQGYRGMIVPIHAHGSLAVLDHDGNADPKTIDAVAAQVLGALDWTT